MGLYISTSNVTFNATWADGSTKPLTIMGNHYLFDDSGMIRVFTTPQEVNYLTFVLSGKRFSANSAAKLVSSALIELGGNQLQDYSQANEVIEFMAIQAGSYVLGKALDGVIDQHIPKDLHYISPGYDITMFEGPFLVKV